MNRLWTILFFSFLQISCGQQNKTPVVLTGLDRIDDYSNLFENKNIGIVTNHTGYDIQNRNIVDVFRRVKGAKISALFGPEHGLYGNEEVGKGVKDTLDAVKGIRVYSLYGKNLKPTPEMLKDVDLLVFDIQDVGARFYTYISTMALTMEAAVEHNLPFVVLDRPNPINGINIEGNVLDTTYASFVGLFPIPVRHGMTIGELARMINSEGWLAKGIQADLTIVPMSGWQRKMWFDQTGLTWRAPSPNIPDLAVATVYPGMCLFEGTNISEGRGSYQPFLRLGAPWLNIHSFENINNLLDLPGLTLGPISFVPKSIPNMAPRPKYMDEQIFGVALNITNRETFRPYLAGIVLVKYFHDISPESFKWREKHFDRLCGTDLMRKFISEGKTIELIKEWMDKQSESFAVARSKYLLYQ